MDTEEVKSSSTPLIISDGCCVHFGNAPALESVNFAINKGKKVAVVGPNGGGKSTLFKMIVGQESPDAGSFKIGDTVNLSYVDQSREMDPKRSIYEV